MSNCITTTVLVWVLLSINTNKMNTKRNFGTFLTTVGMVILIFTAIQLIYSIGSTNDVKIFALTGIPGLMLFFSGIGLSYSTIEKA